MPRESSVKRAPAKADKAHKPAKAPARAAASRPAAKSAAAGAKPAASVRAVPARAASAPAKTKAPAPAARPASPARAPAAAPARSAPATPAPSQPQAASTGPAAPREPAAAQVIRPVASAPPRPAPEAAPAMMHPAVAGSPVNPEMLFGDVRATPISIRIGDISSDSLIAMPASEYMNDLQLKFFKELLLDMKRQLLENAGETSEHLRENDMVPDPADRATIEEEHALELRTRDRERKLMKKIDQSLARIEDGSYGYCEETGDPIGLPRLLARPTATLSVEAQQRRELKQKMFGE